MKKHIALISIVSALLFASCGKDKVIKPAPVFSNSFTCEVNGQPWKAETPANINGPIPLYVEYLMPGGNFGVNAWRKNSDGSIYQKISFFAKNVFSIGEYALSTGEGNISGFNDLNNATSCGIYKHDTLNPGTLTITQYDTVNHVIRGTFHMVLINQDCSSLPYLNIQNGSFTTYY